MTETELRENGFEHKQLRDQMDKSLLSTDFIREVSANITEEGRTHIELDLLLWSIVDFVELSKVLIANIKNMVRCWEFADEQVKEDLINRFGE